MYRFNLVTEAIHGLSDHRLRLLTDLDLINKPQGTNLPDSEIRDLATSKGTPTQSGLITVSVYMVMSIDCIFGHTVPVHRCYRNPKFCHCCSRYCCWRRRRLGPRQTLSS